MGLSDQNNYQSGVDEFNMNLGYVGYLNMLVVNFGISRMNDDYDGMYKTLRLLETTISPKADKDKAEKNLNIIKVNIAKMIQKDLTGNLIKYYPELIDSTITLIDDTYSLILQKMDKVGLLTKMRKDPKMAFGNFGGS